MRCHYCEEDADIAVSKEGVRVGVCESHFRDRLDELRDDGFLEELGQALDADGS